MNADNNPRINGSPYQYRLNPNGGIEDFGDFRRADRFREHDDAKAQNDAEKADRRNKRSEDRYNNLKKKYGEDFEGGLDKTNKKLSSRDKKFAEQWEKFKKQRDAENQKKKLEEELPANVQKIKDKLEKLGLK